MATSMLQVNGGVLLPLNQLVIECCSPTKLHYTLYALRDRLLSFIAERCEATNLHDGSLILS